MAALGLETYAVSSQQVEQVRVRTPLVVPSWPAEWEQDLVELQVQLAQHASLPS